MLTLREKSPLLEALRWAKPMTCITYDSQPNTPPTELFPPPFFRSAHIWRLCTSSSGLKTTKQAPRSGGKLLDTTVDFLAATSLRFVCWLVAYRPSNMLVYLRDGSAQTILRAATLRQKLQIQLSTSPSHSILTSGRPVPALAL